MLKYLIPQWKKWSITAVLIALTTACSEPDSVSQTAITQEADLRPNLILIVADDLGYTDLGLFGSEISTPNLDSLAQAGMVFTNYYSSPICAPTRAQLMSGTDNHRAGQGMMQVNIPSIPGYDGRINDRVKTLAERLQEVGYRTYMTGKWHLGYAEGQTPDVRGFDRSFSLLDGSGSHFSDQIGTVTGTKARYREDDQMLEQLPDEFYSTDFYTDTMIGYIEEQENDDQPFFAYLAYTAPHWPLQAPEADITAQAGRYDLGYDVLRQERFDGWLASEFAPESAELSDLSMELTPWDELTADDRAISARKMEIYAAMVERMDQQVGRLVSYLKETGQYENTLILFQSDNGAEAGLGFPNFGNGLNGEPPDNSLENLGRPGSFAYLGPSWVEAISAPFYRSKSYATEGGIHVPAFVAGGALNALEDRDDALIMSYDVAPTFLELAQVDPDTFAESAETLPITGRSFASLLSGDNESGDLRQALDAVGWEHGGQAAVRRGDWKLLWLGNIVFYQGEQPSQPGPPPMSGAPMPLERFDRGGPAGDPIGPGGPWKLYNIKEDPAELYDLSSQYPEIVAQLLEDWDNYVTEYSVLVKSGEGEIIQ